MPELASSSLLRPRRARGVGVVIVVVRRAAAAFARSLSLEAELGQELPPGAPPDDSLLLRRALERKLVEAIDGHAAAHGHHHHGHHHGLYVGSDELVYDRGPTEFSFKNVPHVTV